jgi:hypothetical protein
MIASSYDVFRIFNPKPKTTHDAVWHLWRAAIPRRSITGRLAWGTVWSRRDEHRWIYKKYIDNTN